MEKSKHQTRLPDQLHLWKLGNECMCDKSFLHVPWSVRIMMWCHMHMQKLPGEPLGVEWQADGQQTLPSRVVVRDATASHWADELPERQHVNLTNPTMQCPLSKGTLEKHHRVVYNFVPGINYSRIIIQCPDWTRSHIFEVNILSMVEALSKWWRLVFVWCHTNC